MWEATLFRNSFKTTGVGCLMSGLSHCTTGWFFFLWAFLCAVMFIVISGLYLWDAQNSTSVVTIAIIFRHCHIFTVGWAKPTPNFQYSSLATKLHPTILELLLSMYDNYLGGEKSLNLTLTTKCQWAHNKLKDALRFPNYDRARKYLNYFHVAMCRNHFIFCLPLLWHPSLSMLVGISTLPVLQKLSILLGYHREFNRHNWRKAGYVSILLFAPAFDIICFQKLIWTFRDIKGGTNSPSTRA